MTVCSASLGNHKSEAGPSVPGGTAMSAGNFFLLVENVRSSAYREYVQPALDASFTKRMSSKWAMRFEMTDEQGLPCGSELSSQAICAITVATSSFSSKSRFLSRKPRTLPKLIE